MIDPLSAEPTLRYYATARSVDLDELANAAGRPFTSPVIVRRTAELTDRELAELFNAELRETELAR